MKSRLPDRRAAARRVAVLGRLLSIVMTISLLFGNALSPAIAHARDGGAEHSAEVLQLEQIASTVDSQSGGDTGKKEPVVTHHHCTIAVETDAPDVALVAPIAEEAATPGLTRVLGSLAQPPPIEPPAA